MSTPTLRRLHRWIGLACALGLLMASASGILHVVMTWTQSSPPRAQPTDTIDLAQVRLSPTEASTRLGPETAHISAVSLRLIAGEPWWQFFTGPGTAPRYLSARDGREDPSRDAAYAVEIASRHLGNSTGRWSRRLDAYDREYLPLFRLLPVHRIDFADNMNTRLYVSTLTGSVARHTDNQRQREANLFSLLHKYQFIANKTWRDATLVTVTSLMFLTSLGGIVLFFVTRTRPRPASPSLP